MKQLIALINKAWIVSFIMSSFMISAMAAESSEGSSTIGGMIYHIGTDMYGSFLDTGLFFAFLMGMFLVGRGVYKLHGIATQQGGSPKEGLLMVGGGSSLLGINTVMGGGLGTVYGDHAFHSQDSSHSIGSVASCMTSTGDAGITCVAKNIATNVVPIFTTAFFAFCMIGGFFMVFNQIHKLAVSHAHGRHELEKGWFAKLGVGILICNVPFLIHAMETTMGITNSVILQTAGYDDQSSLLTYTAGSSDISAQYAELLGYIFRILVIFGIIAVWRGVMLLKSFSEGQQNKTMGAALTHIMGGTLLANAQFTVCLVLTTAWGAGNGFC